MLFYQNTDLSEAIWIIKLLNYYHSFFLKKKCSFWGLPHSQGWLRESTQLPSYNGLRQVKESHETSLGPHTSVWLEVPMDLPGAFLLWWVGVFMVMVHGGEMGTKERQNWRSDSDEGQVDVSSLHATYAQGDNQA